MKIITITSGKGGVGKTTTAINLGVALNSLGKEVIVVDANLSTPNIGLHLGAPIVPINFNHVLAGKAKITDAIYEHRSGTKIVPSSLSLRELKRLDYKKIKEVSKKLKKIADYVILDSSAGLGEEAISSMEAADELIIVTNPEIPAVTDALKTIKLAEKIGKEVKGVIVTRVRGDKNEMSLSNIKDMLDMPILGVIPEDKKFCVALKEKNAFLDLYPYSKASIAYKKIAASLANIKYEEPSFFERLFGTR